MAWPQIRNLPWATAASVGPGPWALAASFAAVAALACFASERSASCFGPSWAGPWAAAAGTAGIAVAPAGHREPLAAAAFALAGLCLLHLRPFCLCFGLVGFGLIEFDLFEFIIM